MDAHVETTISDPGWENGLWWVVLTLLGAGAGWLALLVVGWLAERPRVPLPGVVELFARLPEPAASTGAVALGAAAGLAVARQGQRDSLTVTVSPDRLTLRRAGTTTALSRRSVAGGFLDGGRLVVLGPATEELARVPSDLDAQRLRRAFESHGYRWYPADPYRDRYRRWVPGSPDLPAAANALLSARERALGRGDAEDADELRLELARLGIAVRHEQRRQYWRRHEAPGSP